MKKYLVMILAATMILSLAACGGPSTDDSTTPPVQADGAGDVAGTENGGETGGADATGTIAPATDGELTLSTGDIAVVVNGTKVLMPYNLVELENAGVPVNEMFREDELGSGESFGLNLYLDENEDYLLIPDYYNGGDAAVALTAAEAKTITMVSFASEPVDQGISLLGVTFGMSKGDVKALLGEPMTDDGMYCDWQIVVTDADYIGNISMYFTEDSDDAGVNEVRLDFMEW